MKVKLTKARRLAKQQEESARDFRRKKQQELSKTLARNKRISRAVHKFIT